MTEEEKKEKKEKQDISHLKPWQFQKGQSGNPAGRPKGKSLKQFCKVFLSKLNDKERLEFMHGIPKEVIWKMAEGNPEQEVKAGVTISDLLNKVKDGESKQGTTGDGGETTEQGVED